MTPCRSHRRLILKHKHRHQITTIASKSFDILIVHHNQSHIIIMIIWIIKTFWRKSNHWIQSSCINEPEKTILKFGFKIIMLSLPVFLNWKHYISKTYTVKIEKLRTQFTQQTWHLTHACQKRMPTWWKCYRIIIRSEVKAKIVKSNSLSLLRF